MRLCQRFNHSRSMHRREICTHAADKQEALPPMGKGFLSARDQCVYLYLNVYLNSTIFLVSTKSPACRRQK